MGKHKKLAKRIAKKVTKKLGRKLTKAFFSRWDLENLALRSYKPDKPL
jgi:hypothetical protein